MDEKFIILIASVIVVAVVVRYLIKRFNKSVDREMQQHKDDYRNLTP